MNNEEFFVTVSSSWSRHIWNVGRWKSCKVQRSEYINHGLFSWLEKDSFGSESSKSLLVIMMIFKRHGTRRWRMPTLKYSRNLDVLSRAIIQFILPNVLIKKTASREKFPFLLNICVQNSVQLHSASFSFQYISEDKNPNNKADHGWTPLHEAAQEGHLENYSDIINHLSAKKSSQWWAWKYTITSCCI